MRSKRKHKNGDKYQTQEDATLPHTPYLNKPAFDFCMFGLDWFVDVIQVLERINHPSSLLMMFSVRRRATSMLIIWRTTSMLIRWRATSMLIRWRATSMLIRWRATSLLIRWRATSLPLRWRATSMPIRWRATSMPIS